MKISQLKKRIDTIDLGPRLGHFLIDLFLIEVINYVIDLIPLFELSGLFSLFTFPAYYIFFEYYYQWTPGKYVTNSIVINDTGERPDIQTIILRTFIRFVPFEPFSCLDSKSWGWHDRWTKTYVIQKDKLNIIKEKIGALPNEEIAEKSPFEKHKKSIAIIAIIAIVGVSGYFLVRKVNEFMNFSFETIQTELDAKDYELIQGHWNSEWMLYKSLHFKSSNSVDAVNNNGDTLNLNYSINSKVLSLNDSSGLNLQFIILDVSNDSLIIRDIQTMKDNIVFKRNIQIK